MSNRWNNVAIAASAVAGAVAGLVGVGYYLLLKRPLARTEGSLSLPGLEDPVEVLRDRWGVPHIYARSVHDLLLAQGFVHAQDRLWQMDFARRLVAGRLSEVMGEQTVPLDRWMRTLTIRRVAEQEVDLLDDATRADLEAYVAGVNARIAQGRLPVEFTLLRYAPEPWTVADSLSWIKMMSWVLSVNWETEILRELLIERLGPELAAELEPGCTAGAPRIVRRTGDLSVAAGGAAALARAAAGRSFSGPGASEGLGSNNWVISGSRTASGMPLLANDMHLGMTLPSVWYENHLVGGDLALTGVTFPGIPGVVAGHNGHVAWGYTNGFPDVQDLYVERLRHVDGDGDDRRGRVQYEFRGEWRDAQAYHEEIKVKGAETVTEDVIVTHHGPIINLLAPELTGRLPDYRAGGVPLAGDAPPGATPVGEVPAWSAVGGINGPPLALRWTSLDPDGMIESIFGVARAKNCLEFREALRRWTSPTQNVVYADTEGNIGYSFPGKVPIRAKGDGEVPVPGWTGEYEWTGYIPYEELPHLYNPPQGYIATANNRVVDGDYPYYLGYDHCTSNRAQRIVELIEARDKIDLAYIKQMQFDQIAPVARSVGSYLGELETSDPELRPVVALMSQWDGTLAVDSAAAAVYQVFCRRMIARTLGDRLGDLASRYAGKGPTPVLAEGSMFGERSWEWLEQVMQQPDSHWFDLGNGETRDDVARLALREAVDFLKDELGPETGDWAWGKLHTLTFSHVMGQVKPLDRLFNRGPYPVGGDGTSVWATQTTFHDLSSDPVIGPPFRFIADLGDLRNSLGLLVPGQSGQPGSRHFDDQVDAWFSGGYHPMLWDREDVEAGAEAVLKLTP
jgi:penicillin amidase